MHNLFKFTCTRFLAVLLLFTFAISITTHANTYSGHVLKKPGYEKVFDFGIMPERIVITDFKANSYALPISQVKPDNINYQLIRKKTLGLTFAQRNI